MRHLTHRWLQNTRRVWLGLMVAAAALLAPAASAQYGQAAGLGKMMEPEYVRRDVLTIVQALDLDQSQANILEGMFIDYMAEHEAGLEEMRSRLSNLQDQINTDDVQEVLAAVFKPLEDWRDQRKALGEEFLNNLRLILNDQQLNQWERFRRELRREKGLPEGQFAGEHLNLFHVVRDMHLDPIELEMIEPVLNEYELQLDQLLQRRHEVIEESEQKLMELMKTQNNQDGLRLLKQQIDARVAVRNLNDTYAVLVRDALPEHLRDDFYRKAMIRAYPSAYRRSDIERAMDEALRVEFTDNTQREAVQALHVDFTTRMDQFRAELVEEIRDYEPKAEENRAEVYAARQAGKHVAKLQNPLRQEIAKRDRIEANFMQQLKLLLSDEQFASLPQADRWLQQTEQRKREAQQRQIHETQRRSMERGSPGAMPENSNSTINTTKE